MPRTPADEDRLDELRSRLADLGITLFDAPRPTVAAPSADEYATLVVDLLRSGDSRLRLAIPCLVALHDGEAARSAVDRAAASVSPSETDELGLLYRLARCLVTSRAPLLSMLFGRRRDLPALPIEPVDLPDPSELRGEWGLRFASELFVERGLPDLPGGAERQFDTWLDIAWAERRRVPA